MAKMFTGTVSSAAADKTIVVTVNSSKTHPLYRKQYTVSKKFMAHDEKNQAQVGDKVSIIETKPLSARKRFMLKTIVEKATVQHVEAEVPAEVAAVVAPVAKTASSTASIAKAKDDKKATEAKTAKTVSEESK